MASEKVVLVNLPWTIPSRRKSTLEEKGFNIDSRSGLEHVGLLYLQTLLENAGIDTRVCDFAFDEYHGKGEHFEVYMEQILGEEPNIIGFSPYFTSIRDTLKIAKDIKKHDPKVKITLGGYHASHTAKEILEDNPFIDAVFLGEAVGTIAPGIERLLGEQHPEDLAGIAFRKEDEIINNGWGPNVDLDELPFPKRSKDMYETIKTVSIVPTMGCLAKCTFCAPLGSRHGYWRSRSPKKIVEEIKGVVREFGINTIEMHCEDAFGSAKKAIPNHVEFAKLLIASPYKIRWRSVLRPTDFKERGKLLDKTFWDLLRESGLERVYIGFEAGTDERLERIRKPATVATNQRAHHFLCNAGIAVQSGFIMFFPDSNSDEIRSNHDFLYGLGNVSYHNYSTSLILHPGSELFESYKREGKLQRPFYMPQSYQFSDSTVKKIHTAYSRFISDQRIIDTLCLDLDYARVWGKNYTIHLGKVVKVDEEFLEKRANDLYLTGRKVLDKPEKALIILGEFNERWKNEYRGYLKENAKAT